MSYMAQGGANCIFVATMIDAEEGFIGAFIKVCGDTCLFMDLMFRYLHGYERVWTEQTKCIEHDDEL